MIVIALQLGTLAVFAWLLRGSEPKPLPQEKRERVDRVAKH